MGGAGVGQLTLHTFLNAPAGSLFFLFFYLSLSRKKPAIFTKEREESLSLCVD